MKTRTKLCCVILSFLFASQLWSQTTTNTNPVVSNVVFSITGTTVTVTYDVTDTEQSSVNISMEVSSDGGVPWDYDYNSPDAATGDIGANVAIGLGKTIKLTYSGAYNPDFMIKIIANDLVIDGGPCADTTVRYAGKIYHTVQIGSQCWLKENLDAGAMMSGNSGQINNSAIEKYCWYDNSEYCAIYGGYYQWAEAVRYKNGAMNSTVANPALAGDIQGICPAGWHIPAYTELQALATSVNSNGNALMATGTTAGTNATGFSALLAGYRNSNMGFYDLLINTTYWSSTEVKPNDATVVDRITLRNDGFGLCWS
ncbi:MAG: FISUMP domain-containing protein [Ignavibacteria bacterium]